MRINIIVPRLSKARFSGGILCIFEYAAGLARSGHTVSVIPLLPSPQPEWFEITGFNVLTWTLWKRIRQIPAALASLAVNATLLLAGSRKKGAILDNLHDLIHAINLLEPRILPPQMQQGTSIDYLRRIIPEADITVATSYETALPARVAGKGKRCYFMQHFEPYFANESSDPELAKIVALQSYHLDLAMIANSSWLRDKVAGLTGAHDIRLCVNAIDHSVYNGTPAPVSRRDEIRIISYGGRNAQWKGFCEMAQAVAIARRRLPGKTLIWRVYGDALLPPDNEIAPYVALGFLRPGELAAAYRECDLLLSASWYESFPLFPLEAMACGLPVITTRKGTEDYAIDGINAHIVQEKAPESIADGIIRLVEDEVYRHRLAEAGHKASRAFTWGRSVQAMESILGELCSESSRRSSTDTPAPLERPLMQATQPDRAI